MATLFYYVFNVFFYAMIMFFVFEIMNCLGKRRRIGLKERVQLVIAIALGAGILQLVVSTGISFMRG